jgi:hypothetical protein
VKTIRIGRLTLAALVLLAAGTVVGTRPGAWLTVPAQAQNLGMRTISGAVLDATAAPIVGATVFLKDQKTKELRSFTSVEKGHFYFTSVNKIDDYELWAEKDGKKTETRTVSSWDSRAQFIVDLKMK